MRGRVVLAALACVAGMLGCTDRRRPTSADGRLMVVPAVGLDFSRVGMHDTVEQTVSLRNVGRGPLRIEEIWLEGSNGTAYQAEVIGGSGIHHDLITSEERQLIVRFVPLSEGEQPAFLVIRTDSRPQPITRLPLRGVGVDARAVITERELSFGRIEAQARKTQPLTLRNISDLPIQITLQPVGEDADEFETATFSMDPFEERKVDVTFKPERVGKKRASLQVIPCAGCEALPVALKAEAIDRAVIAEPWELDFGPVPIDQQQMLSVKLHNISTEPMQITGRELSRATDVSFTEATAGAGPFTLAPDESREFKVNYSPGHMGLAEGQLAFGVVSVRNPQTAVPIRGWGGAAELCISPADYWFGNHVPVGSKTSVTVTLRNCGSSNDRPLTIESLTFGGEGIAGEDQFSVETVPLPRNLMAGESMTFKIYFEPNREGLAGGHLFVKSSAYGGSTVKAGFNGVAETHTACTLRILPQVVDFGTVVPGYGAVLGVKIENRSSEVCAVKNIRLADDGGGVFTLPGGRIDGLLLNPGDYFSLQIAFVAPAAATGGSIGTLQVESADPANPLVLVPLRANAQGSCLVANPRWVDFGVARPDCPPAPRQVNLLNACATPVQVNGLRIGPGTTDTEFALGTVSAGMPVTLAPGQAFTAEIQYRAQVAGMNLSPLYVDVTGLASPLLVPLIGESYTRINQTDRFVQQDGSKVDVLFVVDNTASMVEEHPRLIAALPAFANAALSKGVNLHVAVTTTGIDPISNACPGGAMGGEAGRFFPADNSAPRILTQATPDLAGQLQRNANVGQCAVVEQGMEAVRRALTSPLVNSADDTRTPLPDDGNQGFLRNEAGLAVVFVGDEDDHSPDSVDTYVRFLQTLKGINQPQRAVIYAIAPTEESCGSRAGDGLRYAEAARKTGGQVLSICADDYSPLLTDVASKAFAPQDRFPLSGLPMAGTLQVFLNGTALTTGWSYDPGSNSVVFATRPAAGAKIDVKYVKACS